MNTEFHQHDVVWTREKAQRFWAYFAGRDASFSSHVGDAIIQYTRKQNIPMTGRVLDYGCGPGYFLEKLVAKNIACEGAEFSKEALDVVNEKFSGNELFKGMQQLDDNFNHLESDTFDTVFFIETLEHILPEELDAVLTELSRILKPGGYLVITTPNEEPIDKRKVICPDCGCIFHRVQHVSRWSHTTLSEKMSQFGMQAEHCQPVVFRQPSFLNPVRDFLWNLENRTMPHLFYAGKKLGGQRGIKESIFD